MTSYRTFVCGEGGEGDWTVAVWHKASTIATVHFPWPTTTGVQMTTQVKRLGDSYNRFSNIYRTCVRCYFLSITPNGAQFSRSHRPNARD